MTPEIVRPSDAGCPTELPAAAGILLAAGRSERFGPDNKLLIEQDGEPIVRQAARTLLCAPVDPVVVVLGHEADQVRNALADLPFGFVENPSFRDGQATSVRAGVAAIAERAPACVIALGDMPDVAPATVRALLAAYEANAGDALAAAYGGQRGNPVLFDRQYFEALQDLAGDVGGREILRDEGTLVETDDPGVRRDIDRPADLSH